MSSIQYRLVPTLLDRGGLRQHQPETIVSGSCASTQSEPTHDGAPPWLRRTWALLGADTFARKARRTVPGWAVLALCCMAQFMVVLDISIVNVALPQMKSGLHLSPAGQQWVINAFTLTFAGLLLLGGRAADLFGRRRVFLLGLGLFTGFSLLGGLAQNGAWLVTARALQGTSGAVLAPATLSLLTTTFSDPTM